jgi:hypothetical protein
VGAAEEKASVLGDAFQERGFQTHVTERYIIMGLGASSETVPTEDALLWLRMSGEDQAIVLVVKPNGSLSFVQGFEQQKELVTKFLVEMGLAKYLGPHDRTTWIHRAMRRS